MSTAKAKFLNAPMSPRKLKLVADKVRGKKIVEALTNLKYSDQKGALYVGKALSSAMSNAENNNQSDIDELFISKILVTKGMTLKRMRPRARGNSNRILKRYSHISIEVSEKLAQGEGI